MSKKDDEPSKYKEIVEHYRYDMCGRLFRYYRGKSLWEPETKGGQTVVSLERQHYVDQQGRELSFSTHVGTAVCSQEDAFSYKTGYKLAKERALAAMQRDHE